MIIPTFRKSTGRLLSGGPDSGLSWRDAQQGSGHGDQRLDLGPGIDLVPGTRVDVHGAAGLVLHRRPDQRPPLVHGAVWLVFLPGQFQPLVFLMVSSALRTWSVAESISLPQSSGPGDNPEVLLIDHEAC